MHGWLQRESFQMSCQASILFTSVLCKLMFRSACSNNIKKIIFLQTLFCSWMSQTLTNVWPVYIHHDTRGRSRLHYCRGMSRVVNTKVCPLGEFIWFTVYQLPLWSIVKCRCSNLKNGNANPTGLKRNGKFKTRRRKSFKNLWSALECRFFWKVPSKFLQERSIIL